MRPSTSWIIVDRGVKRRLRQNVLPVVALAFFLCGASTDVSAQQTGTITGRVTNSSTNGPISAAQVSIADLNIGALSRDDGRFIILSVPAGQHRVTVTSIGFASQTQTVTVPAGGTVAVDFRVGEQAVTLDEIVVTGVGAAARRRTIGNSLAQIDMSATEAKPITNVESILRGTVAGVSSLSVSGQVGASGTIQLRGVTSVSQGNEPLIYVDGVRLSTSRVPPANLEDSRGPRTSGMSLDDINPQDIERIEIIKGAAATTLYGTEASAGVIQVFTKRGSAGAPQWSMSVTGGGNFWPDVSSVIKQDPTQLDLVNIKRTGAVQGLSGSVRGGNEGLQYFISGDYNDAKGIVDTQESKNWGVTGNFTVKLYEGLSVELNNSYTHRNTRYVPDSNNRHGYVLNVMRIGKGYWPGNRDQSWVLTTELRGITDNFISGARFDYVTGNLRNRVQLGLHQVEAENLGLLPWGYYLDPGGTIGVQRFRDRSMTAEYTGTWEKEVTSSMRSTTTWGSQLYDESRLNVDAGGLQFSGPGEPTVSSAAQTHASETRIREVNAGFFVQETVGFNDRLFLIGGLRMDGSSTFGDSYGFQYYPKVSASYVISDEDFWSVGWVNSLRLRAALGAAGRAPGAFDAVRTWQPIAGMEAQPGVTPQNLGNPNLGPERTREIELGFDAALFGSRLSAELTYYNAKTLDALFPVLGIPTDGFPGAQVRNVGEVQSHGVELTANALVVQTEDLGWNVGTTLTTTHSEVVDMGGAAPFSEGYEQWIKEGYAPPSFFGRKVLNPDALAEPEFESDAFLGGTFPTFGLGVHTDVRYRRVSVSALGELSTGGHIVNATAYLNTTRSIWPACTDAQEKDAAGQRDQIKAIDRARCLSGLRGYDQWVESADFFKLRDVTVSFSIPESWIPARVSSATLSVSGRDLFKSTDYTGLDPEVIEGGPSGLENFRRVDYYTLPPQRSIVAKLYITF